MLDWIITQLKVPLLKELRIRRGLSATKSLLVPFVAHTASVTTIAVAYYARNGSFAFSITKLDVTIAIALTILAITGLMILTRELSLGRSFVVRRSRLNELVQHARAEARHSVHSFAGDVTWLNEDRTALLELLSRKDTPPSIRIYYDPTRLKGGQRESVREIGNAGADLIPYPIGLAGVPRCLLVDKDDPECRVFTYERKGANELGRPRMKDPFIVREYTRHDAFIIDTVSSLADALHIASSIPFRIAITGVNNTGKTTLSNRIRVHLQAEFGNFVHYIEDQYRTDGGHTDLHSNLRVLYRQLLLEKAGTPGVFLFDRSSADNLCYLKMREGRDTPFYNALAPTVALAMRDFDLIVNVVRGTDDSAVATSQVRGPQRKVARDALNHFFESHGISRLEVSTGTDLPEDYESASKIVIAEVNRALLERRTRAA